MNERIASFGTRIRAARLGWGISTKHGAFIRTSDGPDMPSGRTTLVELCPLNGVPIKKSPNREHRVWWENPSLLDMIPWLRGVTRIKKYIAVTINDAGEIL